MYGINLWVRRLLMLLLGVAVTEFGSQLYVALDVGADPFMILVQGISRRTGISYGQGSTILMLVCLFGIFLLARRHIHPGTVFCIFCLGPIVDFYAFLFSRLIPEKRPMALTVALVAAGCLIVSVGIGISVRSAAGACSNDLIPVILQERFPSAQLRWTRMLCDGFCIVIGFLLGGTFGVGTIIALTLYGPGLQFFCRSPMPSHVFYSCPRSPLDLHTARLDRRHSVKPGFLCDQLIDGSVCICYTVKSRRGRL